MSSLHKKYCAFTYKEWFYMSSHSYLTFKHFYLKSHAILAHQSRERKGVVYKFVFGILFVLCQYRSAPRGRVVNHRINVYSPLLYSYDVMDFTIDSKVTYNSPSPPQWILIGDGLAWSVHNIGDWYIKKKKKQKLKKNNVY